MRNIVATIGMIGLAFFCGYHYGIARGEIRLWISHNAAGSINVQRLNGDKPSLVYRHQLAPFDYSHAETITIERR